ncbi:hypothetical protein Hbl1158_05365 [Halobaculum sp. CBA1158]|uniref:DUF7522 family protein n=1 Tax=Halobaculum sp. CBA1158 TaxID=2904243 RepID=UPI001F1957D3|nr:hypothetical protein [Halobaculum sp. CBA1158]UIP00788.1 hypothetical protein Hbl1158_05365 [Halobaculum sp. CBA1158]
MTRGEPNELVQFLQQQAGEYLRGVVHYSDDDYDALYLRDDVADMYTDEELTEFVAYYREKNRQLAPDRPFDLGTDHCTISMYDEAIIFHFTQGTDVGTVVTLSPEAGRDVVQFTTDCLEQLYHNSPQEIDDVPTWLRS